MGTTNLICFETLTMQQPNLFKYREFIHKIHARHLAVSINSSNRKRWVETINFITDEYIDTEILLLNYPDLISVKLSYFIFKYEQNGSERHLNWVTCSVCVDLGVREARSRAYKLTPTITNEECEKEIRKLENIFQFLVDKLNYCKFCKRSIFTLKNCQYYNFLN